MPDINTPYKEIPLTQGKVALVDDEDYEDVSRYRWRACKSSLHGPWYAYRGNPGHFVKLHRYLMGLLDNDPRQADHRNGDGLDNRRLNLRIATPGQNGMNQGLRRDNSTGYKGVRFRKGFARPWYAIIQHIHIGCFNTAEEAARAYDAKALEMHGEFAWLNFPPKGRVQCGGEQEEAR